MVRFPVARIRHIFAIKMTNIDGHEVALIFQE